MHNVHPESLLMHGPHVKQRQQQHKAHQAVCIVPVGKRDHPQQHNHPRLCNGSLVPHGKCQTGKKTVLKRQPECQIQLMQHPGRQVDQKRQDPAQQAVRPGASYSSLAAQNSQNPAFIDLGIAPAAQSNQATMQGALVVHSQQHHPHVVTKTFAQVCHEPYFSISSIPIFQPIQLGQQEEMPAPHQAGHQLLVAGHPLRHHFRNRLGHLRTGTQRLYHLLLLPEWLVISLGIFISDGNQKPCPVGILPPLGPGLFQMISGRQCFLPLHEAAKHLKEIPHVLMGGRRWIDEIPV